MILKTTLLGKTYVFKDLKEVLAKANEEAKSVVKELLTATVQSVDPEFTVVIVQ